MISQSFMNLETQEYILASTRALISMSVSLL